MNVAELEAALKAAKEQERRAGDAAWKQLAERAKSQLDWQIKWFDKYTVAIHARYKPEFLAEMTALDSVYPYSYARINDDQRNWRGMTYMLINNVLVQSGGGWVVLEIPHKNTFRSWRELTEEQVAAIRDGMVPDELKSSNFK